MEEFYENIANLLLLSHLDIEGFLVCKNKIQYFEDKYGSESFKSLLPTNLKEYKIGGVLQLQHIETLPNECKDVYIIQQKDILELESVLLSKPIDGDEQLAIQHILKSINVKYFQLLKSVEKVLQPIPKETIKNGTTGKEEEEEFHLTKILTTLTFGESQIIFLNHSTLQQEVVLSLNIFYREAFSILELVDILYDIVEKKLILSDVEDLTSASKLKNYGYKRRGAKLGFLAIDNKYDQINYILGNITKFIGGKKYDFKDIRHIITHRLDYRTVFDIENIWYTTQFREPLRYLNNVGKNIREFSNNSYLLENYESLDSNALIRMMFIWKQNGVKDSFINYNKLKELFPDFEKQLDELDTYRYIAGFIDDIMNIYIYLYYFKSLINQFHSNKSL